MTATRADEIEELRDDALAATVRDMKALVIEASFCRVAWSNGWFRAILWECSRRYRFKAVRRELMAHEKTSVEHITGRYLKPEEVA